MTIESTTGAAPAAPAVGLRTQWCGELRTEHIGRRVSLCGWVARRREHGESLAFVDLRDRSGIVQCVINGALDARSEWVVRITGTVTVRDLRAGATGQERVARAAVVDHLKGML